MNQSKRILAPKGTKIWGSQCCTKALKLSLLLNCGDVRGLPGEGQEADHSRVLEPQQFTNHYESISTFEQLAQSYQHTLACVDKIVSKPFCALTALDTQLPPHAWALQGS